MAGRILIVDGDPNYREILRTLLENRGYTVSSLEEGYEVINAVRREDFDLIFLDTETGGTRDKALLAEVRKECPGCTMIVVTSRRGDDFIKEAMDAGAYGCVNKPFNPDEVLTMVRYIMPSRTLGQAGRRGKHGERKEDRHG